MFFTGPHAARVCVYKGFPLSNSFLTAEQSKIRSARITRGRGHLKTELLSVLSKPCFVFRNDDTIREKFRHAPGKFDPNPRW